MNSDNMTTISTLNNIEAVFDDDVKSISASPNYLSLVDTLKKSFGEFGAIYVLNSSGVFVPVSSDADLDNAKKNVGDSLRVFLVHAGDGSKYLSRKFLTKWMTKHASGSIPFAQPVVATLVKEGFRPRDIKKNFNVVIDNAGDADLTLAVFHSLCQVKNKCRKRNSAYDGEPRKRRRFSRGERKHDRDSDQMVDVPASARNGQTHERAQEFLELAVNAYPEEARQKVLSKQFAKIILDGNNMLFVTSGLRGLTLSRQRAKAEKMLSIAALAFSQIVGTTIEVVFDQTHLPKSHNLQVIAQPELSLINSNLSEFTAKISAIAVSFPVIGNSLSFPNGTFASVSSARPEFATTDDKLIAWARSNAQQAPVATTTTTSTATSTATTTTNNSSNVVSTSATASNVVPNSSILVVSSDRALAGELSSLGVPLMKPGTWICLFSSLFSTSELSKESAIAWFDNWVTGVVNN